MQLCLRLAAWGLPTPTAKPLLTGMTVRPGQSQGLLHEKDGSRERAAAAAAEMALSVFDDCLSAAGTSSGKTYRQLSSILRLSQWAPGGLAHGLPCPGTAALSLSRPARPCRRRASGLGKTGSMRPWGGLGCRRDRGAVRVDSVGAQCAGRRPKTRAGRDVGPRELGHRKDAAMAWPGSADPLPSVTPQCCDQDPPRVRGWLQAPTE